MANEKDVKKQIIEAASTVYKKWGLKKTTMEDIAAEAGKGKATLYYYFKTKEEVFISVVENEIEDIHNTITRKVNKVSTSSEKIKVYLQSMFEEGRKKVLLYSILRQEVRGNKTLVTELRESFDSYEIQLIKDIIEEGVNKGEFFKQEEYEISTLAFAISSLVRSFVFELILEQDLPVEEVRLETIGNFLTRGLKN